MQIVNKNNRILPNKSESKLHIKLCGLRRSVDVEYANELLPDYVGFILAPSKRRITHGKLRLLSGLVDSRIQRVGVFVNEDPQIIIAMIKDKLIDIAQLHGTETPSYCKALAEQGVRCWKAVRVHTETDIRNLPAYETEAIVFDAFSRKAQGGTGEAFPHEWLQYYSRELPFFIAGGVTVENAGKLAEKYNPFGLDVSSSIETDGTKDYEKMKLFMEAAQAYLK